MGLTREDLKETKWTTQDKKDIAVVLNRYQENDKWTCKIFKKVGILITSHQANRPYLKACVEAHKKLGYWMCLLYDGFIDPDTTNIDYNNFMPAKDVMDMVDLFILTRWQSWGGVLYPFYWLLKWGANAMQQFDYLYVINGDMVIEKPEGFPKLLELMGTADIMGTGPDSERHFNTAGFIVKSKALIEIMKHFEKHFIPFENYEKSTQEFGNTEGRFGRAIKDLELKRKIVEPPYNDQLHISGYGTWWKLVKFRHIHSELNYSYRYKGTPPPSKYLDERFVSPNDMKYIKLYEKNSNLDVLKDWYAKN